MDEKDMMKRRWYTEDEWSKHIGWGKLPKEYAKPEKEESLSTSIKDENHPYESWDQFLIRSNLKRGMKMKTKPFKTVTTEYYEEREATMVGMMERRIKLVTTT